jgi:prepilin signal peptidase PulO-like enzyme (type II secretory pathway)
MLATALLIPTPFIVAVFVLGAMVGSFLNVVALRYNTGRLRQAIFGGGRSHCASCDKVLAWYELVPVISFVLQKGRCRSCQARLSWQYPLVELLTGLLFTVAFLREAVGAHSFGLLLALIILSLLVVIGVYDLRHKIIPNALAYAFAAFALVYSVARLLPVSPMGDFSAFAAILDFHALSQAIFWLVMAGPALFLPFYALWKVSDGRWIGLGDGKLALGMGWFLGLSGGISAVVLAFWLGALVAVSMLAIQRAWPKLGSALNMKSEIPFAPFLIVGTILVYATGVMPTDIVLFIQNLF